MTQRLTGALLGRLTRRVHILGTNGESYRHKQSRTGAALPFASHPADAWVTSHSHSLQGHVSVSTMHLAKGLEFRAVAVMACDDEVIPLQERIESVTDDSDLEDVYNTERHLLYVACTRAGDYLLVTGVKPASEFLDDLRVSA